MTLIELFDALRRLLNDDTPSSTPIEIDMHELPGLDDVYGGIVTNVVREAEPDDRIVIHVVAP